MGSDGRGQCYDWQTSGFNSRSRMGSDQHRRGRGWYGQVSIHAPAWGATGAACKVLHVQKFQFTLPHGERPSTAFVKLFRSKFQFTLPHGERPLAVADLASPSSFQFTLPHGERRTSLSGASSTTGFNSRSRMGSDLLAIHLLPIRPEVSIHAPAWGATCLPWPQKGPGVVSIHAPAWGATQWRGPSLAAQGFQFTLPHGERPVAHGQKRGQGSFQFTLPHGERLRGDCCDHQFSSCFNSRSRMGSD